MFFGSLSFGTFWGVFLCPVFVWFPLFGFWGLLLYGLMFNISNGVGEVFWVYFLGFLCFAGNCNFGCF